MDLLRSLLQSTPTASHIDLSHQSLSDLTPLLPLLTQFTGMKRLDLRGNQIQELPEDLGELETLEMIDLRGNEVRDEGKLMESLETLGRLKEVKVDGLGEEVVREGKRLLPGVTILTHSPPSDDVVEVGEVDEESDQLSIFPRNEFESVASLYDDIHEFGLHNYPTTTWKVDFGEYVGNLAQETSTALQAAQSPETAENMRLKARLRLFDSCGMELTAITENIHPELAKLLDRFIVAKEEIVDEYILNRIMEEGGGKKMMLTPVGSAERSGGGKEEVERLRREWNQEKEELMAEMEGLREENQRYLDVIIKHSKSSAEASLRAPPSFSPEVRPQQSTLSISASPGRQLTLNQLKEFIEELYQAKVRFDQRCMEARLGIEHLSDYLRTHLTHKFGLKSLREEWLAGVYQAVDRYSEEDNDVAVFGKILKNECDEDFRFVQMQVKETATQLLRIFLREKWPLKAVSEVETMLTSRVNGQLSEEEWKHVVTYMYNETDSLLLVSLIRELMQQKTIQSPQAGRQVRLSREEVMMNRKKEKNMRSRIAFADLLKILLDFQLKGHEKFLQGFLRLFQSADKDADGYLNEEEFRELAESLNMGLGTVDMERLLQLVDPYDYQKINFSQCVSLFTNVTPS